MLDNSHKIHKQSDACLLCKEPACTKACQKGMDPERILRKLRFENDLGAILTVSKSFACQNCDAPCEEACVMIESVHIRETMKRLKEQSIEVKQDSEIDLSCEFCGVTLHNPFLLSSSVVASSYEKIARAFELGWAGACYKTICDFIGFKRL